ncbi:MAG: hypothetical protein DRO40_00970 [Thermoprotei archaeon]|nr:MAG: hypothetical protein DRO40_00970 [Thermoprotei archaeon]
MDLTILIPIMIAIAPSLIALAVVSGSKLTRWINAILGGSGWLIALLARTPLLFFIQSLDMFPRIFFASLAAGVFEETMRYFVVKYRISRESNFYSIASIGLGWGLTEAIIIYALQVHTASATYGYYWIDFFPAAIKRNIAIVFHLVMTLLASIAVVKSIKLLLFATISIHTLLDLVAVLIATYLNNPWLVEGLIALLTLTTIIPVIAYVREIFPTKRYIGCKQIFTCPKNTI